DSLLPVLVAQRGILQEGIVARGVEHTGFLGALEQRSPFLFGQWKRRYVISLPELDVHLLRDRKRIGENIVTIAEESRHLVTVLKIEPLVVMQAGWIGLVLLETDANQSVVRLMILAPEEMHIVRGDDRQAETFGELENAGVELGLSLAVVRLDLEVVAVLENLRIPGGRLRSGILVAGHEVLGDLTGHAGGGDDEPLGATLEERPCDAWVVVE